MWRSACVDMGGGGAYDALSRDIICYGGAKMGRMVIVILVVLAVLVVVAVVVRNRGDEGDEGKTVIEYWDRNPGENRTP